jgi:hypothetical protein
MNLLRAQEGHLEVVKTLLEFGGRELAIITRDNGAKCLLIEGAGGASGGGENAAGFGGRELAMITGDDGVKCLLMKAHEAHLEVVKALMEAGGRELVMLTRDDGATGGGECAAGGLGARAADADYAQWSELPLHRMSLSPNLEKAATLRNRGRQAWGRGPGPARGPCLRWFKVGVHGTLIERDRESELERDWERN